MLWSVLLVKRESRRVCSGLSLGFLNLIFFFLYPSLFFFFFFLPILILCFVLTLLTTHLQVSKTSLSPPRP